MSTKSEILALAQSLGYTGGAKTIMEALDALADTLAGEDVDTGRHVAKAISVLAPLIESAATPEGTITITENGTGIDVSGYALADVSVSGFEPSTNVQVTAAASDSGEASFAAVNIKTSASDDNRYCRFNNVSSFDASIGIYAEVTLGNASGDITSENVASLVSVTNARGAVDGVAYDVQSSAFGTAVYVGFTVPGSTLVASNITITYPTATV